MMLGLGISEEKGGKKQKKNLKNKNLLSQINEKWGKGVV